VLLRQVLRESLTLKKEEAGVEIVLVNHKSYLFFPTAGTEPWVIIIRFAKVVVTRGRQG